MSVKWKIFRIVNYLIIVPAIIIILALLIASGFQFNNNSSLLPFYFITACGIVIITNSVINHLWLEKQYPDNYPGTGFRNFSALFFVLMSLVLLLLTVLIIATVYELIIENGLDAISWGEWTAYGLLGFIIICGTYLLVYRIKLRRLIRRNQQHQFNNFLETSK